MLHYLYSGLFYSLQLKYFQETSGYIRRNVIPHSLVALWIWEFLTQATSGCVLMLVVWWAAVVIAVLRKQAVTGWANNIGLLSLLDFWLSHVIHLPLTHQRLQWEHGLLWNITIWESVMRSTFIATVLQAVHMHLMKAKQTIPYGRLSVLNDCSMG